MQSAKTTIENGFNKKIRYLQQELNKTIWALEENSDRVFFTICKELDKLDIMLDLTEEEYKNIILKTVGKFFNKDISLDVEFDKRPWVVLSKGNLVIKFPLYESVVAYVFCDEISISNVIDDFERLVLSYVKLFPETIPCFKIAYSRPRETYDVLIGMGCKTA